MKGDNPYQPPQSLEGPDLNQALSSDFWTGKKIFLLFLSPLISTLVLSLVFFIFSGRLLLGRMLVFAPLLIALGVNIKLATICAKFNEYPSIGGRIFAITTWFLVWGLAQILFIFFSFYMIGLILDAL